MKWRPIKTAPTDGFVLLLYPGSDHIPYVCQGRWVDVPHENRHIGSLRGTAKLSYDDFKGHWQAGYIALYGSSDQYTHWKATSFCVHPTHWQPLPKPPQRLPRSYQSP